MKVLLRNLQNGMYFHGQNSWTAEVKDALDFGEHDRAIKLAQELNLRRVELFIISDNGEPLFGVPLPADTFRE